MLSSVINNSSVYFVALVCVCVCDETNLYYREGVRLKWPGSRRFLNQRESEGVREQCLRQHAHLD